jgi:hypothetical protein
MKRSNKLLLSAAITLGILIIVATISARILFDRSVTVQSPESGTITVRPVF